MQCYLASGGGDPLLLVLRDSTHDISRQCVKDGEKDGEDGITRSGGGWRAQNERVDAASGHPSAVRIYSRRKANVGKTFYRESDSSPQHGITEQQKR
jgi:hypothetical protein